MGQVSSLADFFYLKGLTLPTDQIVALINGLLTPTTVTQAESAVFTVLNSDPNYENVGENAVITDIRLIGKTGYPVTCTQLNVQFRPGEVAYNAADGKLTIFQFNLVDGETVTISSVGATVAGDFGTVLSDIALLKQLTAIIKSGTVFIWDRADPIPANFIDVTAEYAGRFLLGLDPSFVPYNTLGKVGGEKEVTLTIDGLPVIKTKNPANTDNVPPAPGQPSGSTYPFRRTTTVDSDPIGGGMAHNNTPEFKIVRYIRYNG